MIKWGILGLGNIANRFASEILEVDNAKLVGIGSLTIQKLNDFGDKYNIAKKFRFNTYDDLLKNTEIDAVYISTLNNTHADLIIKSARANKHIICEKPMALNYQEIKKVFSQLNKSNVFFLENFAYRAHPQTKILSEIILNKEIGEIYEVETSLGRFKEQIIENKRIYEKKLGGGSILDMGSYLTSLAMFLARTLNLNIDLLKFQIKDCIGKINSDEIDLFSKTTLLIDNKINIKMNTSIVERLENSTTIHGSKGKIKIPDMWSPGEYSGKSILEISIDKNNYKKFVTSDIPLFAHQIRNSSLQIKNSNKEGLYPQMSWQESITNMKILENWMNLLKIKDNSQNLV